MAIYHHSTKLIRRSDGKSATAAAAYRAGEKIYDERTNTTHDYTKKLGVEHTEILTPIVAVADNAWLKDRTQLWNKVEAIEKRYDAQLSREIDIAIPIELDRQQRIDLVREYVQTSYVDRGMVADVCFHDFESNNPHAHIMLSMRELVVDENGLANFGTKNRAWNDRDLLMTHRREWAEIANAHLARAGYDVTIDHRSNNERGIATVPQIHLGVHCAAMRDKGMPTERGDEYERIETINKDIRQRLEDLYRAESDLATAEAELAEIVTGADEVTLLEITEIAIVTPSTGVTTRTSSKREQQKRDETLLAVGAAYPDARDADYYAALERQQERDHKLWQSIVKQRAAQKSTSISAPTQSPEPPVKKWQPTRQQITNLELARSIIDLSRRLGSDFTIGNYRIEIRDERIDIAYKNVPSLEIYPDRTNLIAEKPELVIDQFERNITKEIARELERLEDERKQTEQREIDRPLELEQQYPDLTFYPDLEFGDKLERDPAYKGETQNSDKIAR